MTRAPAVFFGHGNPMNALGGPFAEGWRALGEALEKPRAVLMVSAHWQTPGLAVTAMERPRTIHDFGGFPPELYTQSYPAPGSVALAERVRELLDDHEVGLDRDWGLDHGTWSVLTHVFPKADVPVVQLSLDRGLNPQQDYALGRRLSALREEGVMVAGSGDVVHNLRTAQLRGNPEPYDWAVRFNETVKTLIAEGRHDPLVDWESLGEDARLSIPTDEHWRPLLYVLGAADPGERARFFTDAIDAGSVSMLGVRFG